MPVRRDLLLEVGDLDGRLDHAVARRLDQLGQRLEGLARGLPRPDMVLGMAAQRLDDVAARLRSPAELVRLKGERLEARAARLVELLRDLLKRGASDLACRPADPRAAREPAGAGTAAAGPGGQGARERDRCGPGTGGKALDVPARQLEALSHARVLERGYAIVRSAASGRVLPSLAAVGARRSSGSWTASSRCAGPTRRHDPGRGDRGPTRPSRAGCCERARARDRPAAGGDAAAARPGARLPVGRGAELRDDSTLHDRGSLRGRRRDPAGGLGRAARRAGGPAAAGRLPRADGRGAGLVRLRPVADGIAAKMVERHPHVFGAEEVEEPGAGRPGRTAGARRQGRAAGRRRQPACGRAPRTPGADARRQAAEGRRAGSTGPAPARPGKLREELAELEAALGRRPGGKRAGAGRSPVHRGEFGGTWNSTPRRPYGSPTPSSSGASGGSRPRPPPRVGRSAR